MTSEKQLEPDQSVLDSPEIPPKAVHFLLWLDAEFKEAFRRQLLTHSVDSIDYPELAFQIFTGLMQAEFGIVGQSNLWRHSAEDDGGDRATQSASAEHVQRRSRENDTEDYASNETQEPGEISSPDCGGQTIPAVLPHETIWRRLQEYLVNPIP